MTEAKNMPPRFSNWDPAGTLPERLRTAAPCAAVGDYDPPELVALLEEAARVIATQPRAATDGEPTRDINDKDGR